jgi:polyphosphate kinase
MPRNLDRRVEVLVRVHDPALRAQLAAILAANLDPDDELAWTLDAAGVWTRRPPGAGTGSHDCLQQLALTRATESRSAAPVR